MDDDEKQIRALFSGSEDFHKASNFFFDVAEYIGDKLWDKTKDLVAETPIASALGLPLKVLNYGWSKADKNYPKEEVNLLFAGGSFIAFAVSAGSLGILGIPSLALVVLAYIEDREKKSTKKRHDEIVASMLANLHRIRENVANRQREALQRAAMYDAENRVVDRMHGIKITIDDRASVDTLLSDSRAHLKSPEAHGYLKQLTVAQKDRFFVHNLDLMLSYQHRHQHTVFDPKAPFFERAFVRIDNWIDSEALPDVGPGESGPSHDTRNFNPHLGLSKLE